MNRTDSAIIKGIGNGFLLFTVILGAGHLIFDPFGTDTILGVYILVAGPVLVASVKLIRLGVRVLRLSPEEFAEMKQDLDPHSWDRFFHQRRRNG